MSKSDPFCILYALKPTAGNAAKIMKQKIGQTELAGGHLGQPRPGLRRAIRSRLFLRGDAEVRARHTMMLVTSGELPEKHMAEIAPERRLNWIVDELNGKRHTNGLTIPLHGADSSSIDLAKGEIEGHSILKLRVGENFVRNLPLPADIDSIKATLNGGVLDLRW